MIQRYKRLKATEVFIHSLKFVFIGLVTVCGFVGSVVSSRADSFQLLSARNQVVSQPAGGDGGSVSPILTPDGRFVLFTSSANDLVPGGNSYFSLNLYLRDRASNTTALVSANYNGTGGGNGSSFNGMVSTNGRWVVFQSDASDLASGDTNGTTDIFVRDVQTGSNILVSVATNGGWGDGASSDAAMTPDGRYVAFVSEADNLVPNDTNGIADVFVRDLVNQTTVLASVGAVKGPAQTVSWVVPSGPPVITPDGTRVAFFSAATNLVAGVPNTSAGEVYLRDLVANQTFWVSSNALAVAHITPAGGDHFLSYHPALSGDGTFVVFKTSAATGQKPASILKFDSGANVLSLVASNCLPLMFGDDVYGPEISSEARFIAFAQSAPSSLRVSNSIVFVRDTQLGSNIPVSIARDGSFQTNSESYTPVVSPDGRFVAFVSNATNFVANVISNGFHLYVRDVVAGSTKLADAGTNGVGMLDQYGNAPSLTADGGLIAFASADGNFVANDQNHATDVFLRNMTNGASEMISLRDSTIVPLTGNGISSAAQIAITPDGRWVVFASRASDLVANDFNQDQDIFVSDLTGGTISLESLGLNGTSAAGYSGTPLISSNGQIVVFFSTATNLVPNYTNQLGDIFLRDRVAGTNTLVSVSSDGITAGKGFSWAPAMSQDGRYVAFLSTAANLVALGTQANKQNTFWRDTVLGTTVAVSSNVSAVFPPSISADGRYVTYSTGTSVSVWDSQTSSNLFTVPGSVTSAIISPDGTHVLYQGNNSIGIVDVPRKVTLSAATMFGMMPAQNPAQWSADGRFCVLVARSKTVSATLTNNQVYLYDVTGGMIALLSSSPVDFTVVGNGASDNPVVSANGQYVVYRSSASNVVPGAPPGSNLILFNRSTGSNTVINPGATNLDWSTWASRAAMDATGQNIVFESVQSSLAAGDLNRVPDMFRAQLGVMQDSDGDGIPDWWMMKYFGHATASAADNSRPQDDADGDGFSNLAEYLTGSDPTDPQSCLRLEISSFISDPPNLTMTWPAVPGKTYQLQFKTNLNDPSWQVVGDLVAHPGVSATVPVTPPTGYYRIVAIN